MVLEKFGSKLQNIRDKLGNIISKPVQGNNYGKGTVIDGETYKTTGTTLTTTGNAPSTNKGGGITVTAPPSGGGTTTSTSRGGNGGVSSVSGIPTPAAGQQSVQSFNQQVALDIKQPSTISAQQPSTGIRSAANYFTSNIRYEKPQDVIKGTYQIATKGIKDRRTAEAEARLKEDVARAAGRYTGSAADIQAGYRGYSGTPSGYSYQETPTDLLIRNAKLGDQASLIALTDRVNNKNLNEAKVTATNLLNEDRRNIETFSSSLQQQVNSGQLSVDQANTQLNNYAKELDKIREEKVKQELDSKISLQQKDIDSIAKKGRITRLAVTTAGAIVTGAVVSPLIAAAPKLVQTGALVVGGAAMIKPTLQLSKGIVQQTATGLDVAEFVGPTAGFFIGSSIGLKIAGAGGVRVDPKLNTALQTAELKSISTKALTSETQIRALSIPENQKIELIRQLNMGESVAVKTWKISNRNPEMQKVIDKNLPNYEIVSTSRVQTLDNAYAANTIVKVKIEGGKTKYIDFTTGDTIGIYNPKTKILYSETLSLKGEANKPVSEVAKTYQLTKGETKNVLDMDAGYIKRLVKSESYSFEGAKIKAPEGKQITFKDLTEVALSRNVKRYPTSTSQSVEVQRATSAREVNAGIGKEGETGGVGFNLRNIKWVTERAADNLKNLDKPIEFEKVINRKMKPLEYPSVLKEVEMPKFKEVKPESEKPSSQQLEQQKQQDKQLQKLEKDLGIFQDVGINTKQITESLQKGAQVTSQAEKPKRFNLPLSNSGLQLTKEQEELFSGNRFGNAGIDLDKLKAGVERGGNKIKVGGFGGKGLGKSKDLSVETPIINTKQLQNSLQMQSIFQTPSLQTKQLLGYPKPYQPIRMKGFDRSPPPRIKLPSMGSGAGQQDYNKLIRKPKKAKRAYTASLAAAAFQSKPINISRKQFEKLSKTTFSGAETRPVFNIVDSDKETKSIANKVKKLNI